MRTNLKNIDDRIYTGIYIAHAHARMKGEAGTPLVAACADGHRQGAYVPREASPLAHEQREKKYQKKRNWLL